MRTKEEWLSAYGTTHQNPVNRAIHTLCVPAILFSIVGALSLLRLNWWLNGASVLALPALGFYGRLGRAPFFLMLLMLSTCGVGVAVLELFTNLPLLYLYSAIFVIAWIGQFIGHAIEGKKPSFFEDLKFLLIGPLWVFYH